MGEQTFLGFPGAHYIGKEESEAVNSVIDSKSPYRFYGLDLQNKTEEFERQAEALFNRKHAIALTSGTAALHTALAALEIKEGDEVIIPAYGWSADLMAVLAMRAVPVIAPINANMGIDPTRLEQCFSEKTKAVIAIHMRGTPCHLENVTRISKERGVPVIEDGAQCLGGKVGDVPVGGHGLISIFSFQYHKMITAGEGGLLLTDDETIYERAYRFHDLGMMRRGGAGDPTGVKAIQSFGLNYRLTELQSAILVEQMKKLPAIQENLRSEHEETLQSLESYQDKFKLRLIETEGSEPNYAFLCFEAPSKDLAEQAFNAMKSEGIPINWEGQADAHHFSVWTSFMDRENWQYRTVDPNVSQERLDCLLYLHLSPTASV